jgi:hypothetical protein
MVVTICLQTLDQEAVLVWDLEKDVADVEGKCKEGNAVQKQIATTEIVSGEQEDPISADEHLFLNQVSDPKDE